MEHPALQTTHAVVYIQLMLPAALGVAPAGKALALASRPMKANGQRVFWPSIARPKRIRWSVCKWQASAPRPNTTGRRGISAIWCRRIRATWPQAHFLIFGGELEKARTEALAAEPRQCRNPVRRPALRCAKPPR
ncbi:MAG: hypothetical protein IPN05_08315 [Sulfuritalea sp.]|nr:hypothetical protein [Sulfuritalea sp.]